MGCTSSKKRDESPVKKERGGGWNAPSLPGQASVHGSRNFRPANADFHAPKLQDSSSSDSPRKASSRNGTAGSSYLKKPKANGAGFNLIGSEANGKTTIATMLRPGAVRKSWPDLTAGLPKLQFEAEPQTNRWNERLRSEPETINTWELMAGLDDDDILPKITSTSEPKSSAAPAPRSPPTIGRTTMLVADAVVMEVQGTRYARASPSLLPTESAAFRKKAGHETRPNSHSPSEKPSAQTLAPFAGTFIGKKAGSRERPKSFSSTCVVEELDAAVGRSRTPPPSWNTSLRRNSESGSSAGSGAAQTSHAAAVDRHTLPCLARRQAAQIGELGGQGMAIAEEKEDRNEGASTPLFIVTSGDSSPASRGFGSFTRSGGSSKDGKEIRSSGDEEPALQGRNSAAKDDFSLRIRSRSGEADCHSSPSSPEFSAAASLKDWLSDSAPRLSVASQGDGRPSNVRRSILGALEEHAPVKNSNDRPRQVASRDLEKERDNALFYPELLESFEKAMAQLTEEEWNALRQMEDDALSPRNFLDIVHSLRTKRQMANDASSLGGSLETQIPLDVKKDTQAIGNAIAGEDATAKGNKISEANPPSSLPTLGGVLSSPESLLPLISVKEKVSRWNELDNFQFKCPPAKKASLPVLYSTSLQTDTKMYKDCARVRSILRSLGASFDERNVSLHPKYEQELRQLLGKATTVPRLFVQGKHIGGVDEVSKLHSEGALAALLKDPSSGFDRKPTCLCNGSKFLLCQVCKGCGKIANFGGGFCFNCNGYGLITCPNC